MISLLADMANDPPILPSNNESIWAVITVIVLVLLAFLTWTVVGWMGRALANRVGQEGRDSHMP